MASYGHYGQHAARIGPDIMLDPTSHIQFGSVLPKKAWITLCKTDPDPIWMAPVRFWPNATGPEASQCTRITGPGSGRPQLAHYQIPTFRLGYKCSSTDGTDHIVQSQPRSVLVLTVSCFGHRSGLEASWWARIIRSTSGQCF